MTRAAFAGLGAVLAVLLGVAAPALADTEAESGSDLRITAVEASAYPEIEVTVSAPATLAGEALAADAFIVTEDGDRRDAEVTASTTDGLEVAVVIDTSGSMGGGPLADAQVAAAEFLDQLPDAAEIAVVSYATEPELVSGLSSDGDAHLAAIAGLTADGRTATFDAVDAALDVFSEDEGAQRAVVLLTDGEDNESAGTVESVVPRLLEAEVAFHAVEFLTDSGDSEALEEMAATRGGSVTRADDAENLAAVYETIAAQLASQHTLRYASGNHGPTDVTVTLDHGGVTAEATQPITLPETPTAGDAEVSQPRVLRVETVDAGDHPTVAVTIVAPRELAEHELTAEHFELVEARRARDVTVSRVGGQTQEVALAIDTSGSMQGEAIEAAKDAATDFLAKLPDDARVAVLGFSGEPVELSGFTTDHEVAAAEIAGLEAGGYTALYDTVSAAAELFGDEPDTTQSVVVLSDGGDTASSTGLEEAAEQLADTGASLYAIELVTSETDRAALEALADPGRGLVVSADDPAALADVYDRIAVDLGNLYVLRYRSDQFGTTELEITVESGGVTARTVETVDLPSAPLIQSILGSRWGLLVGALLVYAALAIVILLILAPQRRSSLAGARGRTAAGEGGTALSSLANRTSAAAEEGLRRRGRVAEVGAALERAGLPLRPGEFTVLVVCAIFAAIATGLVVSGPLLAMGLAILAGLGAKIALSFLASRRRAKFADQLGDTLQLLAGSLRAGYSMLQAIDTVAKEADSPTAEEFRRLVLETRLGRDLTVALHAMADRMGSEDFEWVVQAIAIHREVGGDLAEVLDTVAETIRERGMIRRQVKALSAEGRLSAWILMALPFAVGGFVSITNPDYLSVMFEHPAGWAMIALASVLMVVGGLWLRKVVKIVF